MSPTSNKIRHHLSIVDFFINEGCPTHFIIEPNLGSYNPDIMFQNRQGENICVEIQLTQISQKKMKEKIEQFCSEYGLNHDSKMLIISSNFYTKNLIKNNLKIFAKRLVKSV